MTKECLSYYNCVIRRVSRKTGLDMKQAADIVKSTCLKKMLLWYPSVTLIEPMDCWVNEIICQKGLEKDGGLV